MKRILYTFLTAFAAVYSAPGADDAPAATASAAVASEEEADDTADESKLIDTLHKRIEAVDKEFSELASPSESFSSRYKRFQDDASERMKKIEGYKQQADELVEKKRQIVTAEYEFTVIPPADRDLYEREGSEMVKKTRALLAGKSDADLVEGLQLFEKMSETHQGMPEYKELSSIYQRTLVKLEKKWDGIRSRIKKDRQKMTSSKVDKMVENETLMYERLAKKMDAAGKNIEEDWFAPQLTNTVMLDKALERLKRVKQTTVNRGDEPVNVPELLRKYWEFMDSVRDTMVQGKLEDALNMFTQDDAYRSLNSVGRYSLPENLKEDIRKQYENLRSEMHKRQNNFRSAEREETRAISAFEREARSLESRIDRMHEDIGHEKEEEARRAEEAAEAAAREAERKAEEEREAAENDDEDVVKPKKKKGKKKKKAE